MPILLQTVSYLCGILFRKKPPAVEDGGEDDVENPVSSTTTTSGGAGRGDGTLSPDDAAAKPCSPDLHHQQYSLPMPPGTAGGNHHMRTASCGHNLQHRRSNSGVSKLVSSMSLRVMGGAPEEARRTRYFKHEDSVWKKTIILGERCRVPDDEDDDNLNLYDEKGKKIITYHPKSHSGLLHYSRQNTSLDPHHQNL